MSRNIRIEQTNAWYYIKNDSRSGQNMFRSKLDIDNFNALLKELSQRFKFIISSVLLSKSTYYLLIKSGTTPISVIFKELNGQYTQLYNRQYALDGSLFKGRYQSSLIENEHYLIWLWIGLNKTVTHVLYKKENNRLFNKLSNQYCDNLSLHDCQNIELPLLIDNVFKRKTLPSTIGSPDYLPITQSSKQIMSANRDLLICDNVELVIAHVSKTFKVTRSEILGDKSAKPHSNARNTAMLLCQQCCIMPLKNIAKHFNLTHFASVSNRIRFIKNQASQQPALASEILMLKEKITNQLAEI